MAAERLFAALDLPDEIVSGLAAWGAEELRDEALRPVAPEALHMTVCFLGWVESGRVETAIDVLGGIRPRPVRITLAREPVAKPFRRPALFAVEGMSADAAALSAQVNEALGGAGLAEIERRPFWPHVTVARVRREPARDGRPRRPRRVLRRPGRLPERLGGEFCAVRLSLYRSMMRREGSLYVPLFNLDLR
jgi:RNA 2',3'-cyclic 3'-phosphodiesterase